MKGAGILFSEMSPEIDWEDRFNKWYDSYQIPTRMKLPGFVSAQRYKDANRDNYLAIFELDSLAALETPEYEALKNQPHTETRWMLENVTNYSRYLCTPVAEKGRRGGKNALDAAALYAEFFSVPDEREKEFDEWYTKEHVPMLLKNKDWLLCRRFLIEDGEPQPWSHLALHYLADIEALDSAEFEAAHDTEWRHRLAEEPWFQGSNLEFERWGERFMAEK